ncbi:DUF6112 family protein [Microbacterium sp. CH-015]|uniref:DUF6112 family protein n=1 Tax=Microbacterium sp. CH-015 TaxID=3406734 RepID=UPI003C7546F4
MRTLHDITAAGLLPANVFPDFGAIGDSNELGNVIGALLTIVLIISVLMLIVCAVTWAIAAANGHHQVATKARIGAWTALGAAALAGAGVAWMNWLLTLGNTL